MATLDIDGISLEIDIVAWATERLTNAKQRSESWVSACCPFHDDSNPSFAVHIDEGVYACQACGAKGGFTKLFAHVEKMTMDDAERELIVKYGRVVPATWKALELDFGEKGTRRVEVSEAKSLVVGHSQYLAVKRGISPETQELYGAGRLEVSNQVAMPWFDWQGRCLTNKVRAVDSKRFAYLPSIATGTLRRTLYGVHVTQDPKMAILVEGEIDAMSVAESGHIAYAVGMADVSRWQIAFLRSLWTNEVVVFSDNDRAGRKMLDQVVKALGASKTITTVDWSLTDACKDANDVLVKYGPAKVREMIDKRVPAPLTLKFE